MSSGMPLRLLGETPSRTNCDGSVAAAEGARALGAPAFSPPLGTEASLSRCKLHAPSSRAAPPMAKRCPAPSPGQGGRRRVVDWSTCMCRWVQESARADRWCHRIHEGTSWAVRILPAERRNTQPSCRSQGHSTRAPGTPVHRWPTGHRTSTEFKAPRQDRSEIRRCGSGRRPCTRRRSRMGTAIPHPDRRPSCRDRMGASQGRGWPRHFQGDAAAGWMVRLAPSRSPRCSGSREIVSCAARNRGRDSFQGNAAAAARTCFRQLKGRRVAAFGGSEGTPASRADVQTFSTRATSRK
jgi:hypothetical protein